MGLMDFLKRKRAEADAVNRDMITLGRCSGGCAGCSCAAPVMDGEYTTTESVRVLGPAGDASRMLAYNAQQAVDAAGLQIKIEHLTDMAEIMLYGVMPLPALVVDDVVVATGRELSPEEIGAFLKA